MIPTVIIEEHNEAFLVWHWARQKGLIEARSNSLIHIDAHSDLATPRLRRSIHDLQESVESHRHFTYNELTISTFIMPAVYQGLIDEIHWVKQGHKKDRKKERQQYVRSLNGHGKSLTRAEANNREEIEKIEDPDRKWFQVLLSAEEELPEGASGLLDFDLDYFSTIEDPLEYRDLRIEISKAEYEGFVSNKYHPLKHLGFRFEAVESEGKYYYLINETDEVYASRFKVSNAVIADKIGGTVRTLEAKGVQPKVITVCRSQLSGYTPEDQCEYIQEELLFALSNSYNLEVMHIDDVLSDWERLQVGEAVA